MNNWFIGATQVVSALCIFALGWIFSAAAIGKDCRTTGTFYFGDKVYDCKLKEKNT
jgi:hypothetical protein